MATEVLEGAEVERIEPRWGIGAVMAFGRIGPFKFEALVYRERAGRGEWELRGGRVGMLKLKRRASGEVVFCWDKRMVQKAVTAQAGEAADLLALGLADHIFGG